MLKKIIVFLFCFVFADSNLDKELLLEIQKLNKVQADIKKLLERKAFVGLSFYIYWHSISLTNFGGEIIWQDKYYIQSIGIFYSNDIKMEHESNEFYLKLKESSKKFRDKHTGNGILDNLGINFSTDIIYDYLQEEIAQSLQNIHVEYKAFWLINSHDIIKFYAGGMIGLPAYAGVGGVVLIDRNNGSLIKLEGVYQVVFGYCIKAGYYVEF